MELSAQLVLTKGAMKQTMNGADKPKARLPGAKAAG